MSDLSLYGLGGCLGFPRLGSEADSHERIDARRPRYRLVQEHHVGTVNTITGERDVFYWAIRQGDRLVFRTRSEREGEQILRQLATNRRPVAA